MQDIELTLTVLGLQVSIAFTHKIDHRLIKPPPHPHPQPTSRIDVVRL